MGILIQNVNCIDPKKNAEFLSDVLVEGEKIAAVAAGIPAEGHTVVEGKGLCLCPGLWDIHVHLRDPGLTYKEDIYTGTAAAAAGGVTTVACMPNTKPAIDTPDTVNYVLETAEKAGNAHVLPIGAVTMGELGKEMTDFDALKQAGVCAFSDDGMPVMSALMVRRALQKAKELNMAVISHCEDGEMVKNYAVNEGKISEKLGLPGRPAIAEDLMVARDIMLAADTDSHIHIAHVSTKGSVDIIREAKEKGVHVTAETCPQYFMLTEEELLTRGTMARVNPPLRTEEDRLAILAGVLDGTLDCIVTDHAPHSAEEKAKPLPEAPSGLVGLETSLGACLTALYHSGKVSLPELIRKMTVNPAAVLGQEYGALEVGAPADLCLFDPNEVWTVDPEQFRSKGRNTVFAGRELKGRVKMTVCGGKIVYQR